MRDFLKGKLESKYVVPVVCLILLVICLGIVAPKLSMAETYATLTESLDKKRSTAIEMSAVLAGASVAIASVPGDATTPIAEQIAGMNSYLIVVIAAIMLEKYMLPIIGMFVSYCLAPAALILTGLYPFLRKRVMLNLAVLMAVLSVALMMVIPAGIAVGNEIDRAYGMSTLTTKIQEDMKILDKESSGTKKESSTSDNKDSKSSKKSTSSKKSEKEDEGVWGQVKDFFSEKAETITESASVGLESIKVILGDFMDVIAALIISTCVIPIIICLVFYWIAKLVFSYLSKLITGDEKKQLI